MAETKKLFVVSDVHGYLSPLQTALASAGFDKNDPAHIFICCGDLFDKDNLSEEFLDFISGLQHKILILGDREESLSESEEIAEVLRALIKDMRNYYETEHYLFVHGWIPTEENFHSADENAWNRARKVGWHECYGENDILPQKTIICGHIPTRLAYTFAPSWDLSDNGIYYGDGVIAVNGGVESCGKINVLVLEA